ncbi:MAG: tetratricopeptide repeat protein [Kiritimatiellales bacterium]|nr:tetratricopeptide repeat protein [Kiritimatiellales bacterium]
MRKNALSILIGSMMLCATLAAIADDPVPKPASARFPNIKASLDDGFFVLAEQQARGVLRAEPSAEDDHEAALLLVHALWGQKRYSEMLELLQNYTGDPGYVYWRARANFELKRYDDALQCFGTAGEEMEKSRYAPSALRLKGHIQQLTGSLDAAESTYLYFAKTFPKHGERIENQFDLADVYTLQKKIPEAIAIYEALAAEPNKNVVQRAQLKLAHVLYTQGAAENFASARNLFAGLATNTATRLVYRIDAWVDLAALEEKDGKRPAAMDALRKAIALSPDARQRVPLKLSLVRILLSDGDTTGALKLLEECRAEAPNETIAAELQLEKADALLQAKRNKEAAEAYQVYLDVAADAEGQKRAYFGKGLALWELERFDEAAAAFDKVGPERADALFKAGDAYYRAGKFEDAGKRYRAFLTGFPSDANMPNALYQLGLSLAKTGNRTEALAAFQTLETDHAASPFAEKAALRSADVLLAGEQWEAALDKYTQIGQTYTNGTVAALSLHQRGLVLYQLGRYADAQKAFEGVAANYPQSEYVPQAFYMRGFCLYLQGQVDEAVKTCQAFIKKYPDSEWAPEVIFWLAEQYYNQGNYTQADPLFIRIATSYTGSRLAPRALYWAGRAAAAQANYVQAIERYSEVAKTYPDSDILPQTRFAQGDALSELGEFARAILAFEEIIKNYPESFLVNAAWGRKGDCQFSLAADNPARYAEAMASYQAILDRTSAPMALKLQAEYKVGRCLEKTGLPDKAFSRYMNVVYTFINENVERSPNAVMWFTRSAFGAAALKEKDKAWLDAVQVYGRVIEANVPAKDEAGKRIEKIKNDNWLLFQQAEEKNHVGIDG